MLNLLGSFNILHKLGIFARGRLRDQLGNLLRPVSSLDGEAELAQLKVNAAAV